MDVFLSHSHADRKWAEKLRTAFAANGLSFWSAETDLKPGESTFREASRVIGDTPSLVILVGPEGTIPPDEARAILDAAWNDAEKRLIPILLGDARVPTFLRSAGPVTSMTQAIRVANPRSDWKRAVSDLIQVLKGEAELGDKTVTIDTRKEDRRLQRERLNYIQRVAAGFK
ncbi:MAG TPA: toll/interleukin-1 receptor domain-containing protein [Thermoanaerobaculia bacterium]|nr:toll/interleukin-1 receptor domain-containing protein [Thermoanaerobaculia bacterium]